MSEPPTETPDTPEYVAKLQETLDHIEDMFGRLQTYFMVQTTISLVFGILISAALFYLIAQGN